MPRKFPISAVIGLIFASIALLIGLFWLFEPELCGQLLYIFLILFFGFEFFENVNLLYFTVIPITLVVFYASISVLSFLLWKFASDRVYNKMKKFCDVFVTLLVAPLVLYVVWIPLAALFIYTREWFANHGDIPLYFVLLLVPIFFIFFSKIRFKINLTVGNTTLVFALMWYTLHICKFVCEAVRHFMIAVSVFEYHTVLAATSFILLWLFEQMLRGEDGKLMLLSRVLMSALAVLSMSTVVLACLPVLSEHVWSWRQTNMLLFATPVFALFVAYIVKVNKNCIQHY